MKAAFVFIPLVLLRFLAWPSGIGAVTENNAETQNQPRPRRTRRRPTPTNRVRIKLMGPAPLDSFQGECQRRRTDTEEEADYRTTRKGNSDGYRFCRKGVALPRPGVPGKLQVAANTGASKDPALSKHPKKTGDSLCQATTSPDGRVPFRPLQG